VQTGNPLPTLGKGWLYQYGSYVQQRGTGCDAWFCQCHVLVPLLLVC